MGVCACAKSRKPLNRTDAKPRCTNSCGKAAKAWYCVVRGDSAEPEFEACSHACAEEWARSGIDRLPKGTTVIKLEDL